MATVKHLPLPNKHVTPYIRPDKQESKAMTIVVGIPCRDGFVLAADQQISAPGWHKYHEPKLEKTDGFDWTVVLGYSGLPVLAKEAREKIITHLSAAEGASSPSLTNATIRNCVETVLTEMSQQHFNQLDLSMLIASSCHSEFPELWMFNNTGFHSVFGEFQVLGVGDSSLIRYLQQIHSVHDSVEIAEALDIFLIEKAKHNIDGCGGPTNVISIQSDAKHRWLYEDEIKERADKMTLREEDALRSILLG